MGINICAGRSSGSIERKCVREKKAESVGGGNSRGTIHKDEGGVQGVQ